MRLFILAFPRFKMTVIFHVVRLPNESVVALIELSNLVGRQFAIVDLNFVYPTVEVTVIATFTMAEVQRTAIVIDRTR